MRIIRGIFILFLVAVLIYASIQSRSISLKGVAAIVLGLIIGIAYLLPRKKTVVETGGNENSSTYGKPDQVFCWKGEGHKQKKFAKAIKYCDEGEFGKAIPILEELKDKCSCDSDYLAVLKALSLAYVDDGDSDKAIEIYRDAVEKNKTDARLWSCLAQRQKAAGRTEEAVASWQEQMRCTDSDPEPYVEIASIRMEQKNYEEAVNYAEKALEISFRNQEAHEILCIAYTALGNVEKIAEHQRKYIMFGGSASLIDHRMTLVEHKDKFAE